MSFINFPSPTPVFPVLVPLAWSVQKTPSFTSTVSTAVTAREVMLVRAVFPRWEFTLTYGGDAWLRDQTQNITPYGPLSGFTELEQLAGLYLQCLGPYGEFYYTDPDDSSRSAASVGTGDGSTTTFQLYYPWGSGPFSKPFYAPVGGINTIDTVYFGGVAQSPSLYTLDSTNTKLVFHTAPSAATVITADFHFYFRCRFANDAESFDEWAWNLWEKKSLKFQSVKP